jgi:sugar phosphate isomerase/epimerase
MKGTVVTLNRRSFLAASAAALPAMATHAFAAPKADITVGITVDTRPDWNGPENFMRSIKEAHEVGYHWIETFWQYVERWQDNPGQLKDILAGLNLRLETVSNGGKMRTAFADPAQRAGVIEDHMELVRFIHYFGCDHLKVNCGAPVHVSETDRPKMYHEMSVTFDEIGKRMADMGMKFGIHAHLGSSFQTRRDVDAIMERTNPRWVWFVLDTGHISMAGMDPVELTRKYVSRIVEYHLKDVAKENRGGYKGRDLKPGTYNTNKENLIFFPLGKGGVDFPTIEKILNENQWHGWFTVELDRTATTAKESAAITKRYIETVLKLPV